ncbi:DUF6265 family protein [Sphingomonas sp. GCM10030256]|uniref:DUF6265 family protein n=1 Tax=Sphingomonas sp. GCM10030256 TaxID=3273427 RepID=UPI00360C93C5
MLLPALLLLAEAPAAAGLPSFMAGCWDRISTESWGQECWMEPRAGLMLGAAREGKGAKLESWEQARIAQDASGRIAFFASPRGAAATKFEAREVTANSIEFVNPAHDYPQRIRYSRTKDGLEAEISLADGSKPVRWSYRREGSSTAK